MFSKVFYYFTLIFLIACSPVSFSQSCEDAFSPISTNKHSTTGIESYRQLLIQLAQSSLGVKNLSIEQIKTLETYYHVVQGETGRDETSFARAGNYTFSQRRRIVKFLREVFTPEQVTTLVEDGVVELNRASDLKITRRVLRHFNEGGKVFIQIYSMVFRISQILEKTNNGFLVEVERINERSGQIIKEQKFLITDHVDIALIRADPANMTKILEKTKRGLVVDILEKEYSDFGVEIKAGNKVFFSFKKAIENDLLPKNPTVQDYREMEDILDVYISSNFNQTFNWENTPYRMVNDTIIGNGKVYYNFTDSLEKSLIKGVHNFRLASSELESIFLAIESTRKRIDFSELNLSSFTSMEIALAEEGYKASYIRGIDQVNEWAVVRKKLQELRANSRTTHIEYFVNQILVHIAHIRQGLKNNYSPNIGLSGSKLEQLQRLEILEKEAEQAIIDERVTYEWWLEFNIKLARLMYGRVSISLNEGDRSLITTGLSFFPIMMIIPTIQIKNGPGIIAFNRNSGMGTYPAGLIDQNTAKADKRTFPAPDFFGHDVSHAQEKGNQLYLEYSAGHHLFHKRLLINMENFPPDRRKKAETVYFLMTHENRGKNISYSDRTPQQMREEVVRLIRQDTPGLFKFPDDSAKKEKKVEDLTDTFMEVYNQTLQHQ